MVAKQAQKWVGYLEHQDHDLIGVYTANPGKGGYTIFSDIIRRHYPRRDFQDYRGAPRLSMQCTSKHWVKRKPESSLASLTPGQGC